MNCWSCKSTSISSSENNESVNSFINTLIAKHTISRYAISRPLYMLSSINSENVQNCIQNGEIPPLGVTLSCLLMYSYPTPTPFFFYLSSTFPTHTHTYSLIILMLADHNQFFYEYMDFRKCRLTNRWYI